MKRRRDKDKVYADQEVLDLFADEPELLAVVDAVAATQPRRERHAPLVAGAVVAAVALAALVIVLAAPWQGSGPGIVEQALAAVGAEPIVHSAVSSDLPQDERVNLATGVGRPVRVSVESWVDSERNAVHALIRHDGLTVVDEESPVAGRTIPGLTDTGARLFVTGYRVALERGAATVARRGPFDGREAIWLTVKAGGQQQEVIIDGDSYRPIAFREVGTVASTLWRVDSFDSRPRGAGDFEAHPIKTAEGGRVVGESAVSLSGAQHAAGFGLVWPGSSVGGFSFRSAAVQTLTSAGGNASSRGVVLRYRNDSGQLLEVSEAARPEATYGFMRGRLTFNLNEIPSADIVDLAHYDDSWLGQLRVAEAYVAVKGPARASIIAAAKHLHAVR
jgi:hypothetical protein